MISYMISYKILPRCRAAGGGRWPTNRLLSCKLNNLVLQGLTLYYKVNWVLELLLELRTVTFSSVSSQIGNVCGWWVRTWIGTGGEPSCAEECLDLFQNIILSSRVHPHCRLTCFVRSEKVLSDVLSNWTFLCCPDETRHTCCIRFLFTIEWSLQTLSISLISFVINALLGRQAQLASNVLLKD